jgi:hypothetical protein
VSPDELAREREAWLERRQKAGDAAVEKVLLEQEYWRERTRASKDYKALGNRRQRGDA